MRPLTLLTSLILCSDQRLREIDQVLLGHQQGHAARHTETIDSAFRERQFD